jgi:hypothetical protein
MAKSLNQPPTGDAYAPVTLRVRLRLYRAIHPELIKLLESISGEDVGSALAQAAERGLSTGSQAQPANHRANLDGASAASTPPSSAQSEQSPKQLGHTDMTPEKFAQTVNAKELIAALDAFGPEPGARPN